MQDEFKDWLMKDFKEWTPKQKQSFLHLVKTDPEKAKATISANLIDWGTQFAFETGHIVFGYDGPRSDAEELLEAYKKHFASDLAAMTQ